MKSRIIITITSICYKTSSFQCQNFKLIECIDFEIDSNDLCWWNSDVRKMLGRSNVQVIFFHTEFSNSDREVKNFGHFGGWATLARV